MASQLTSRVTELPNELTKSIDTCDALGIVRLLRQSDAQLFAGWGPHSSINDDEVLDKLNRCAETAASLLKENCEHSANNVFLFSGCGTSGRIAWLCCRSFNRLLSLLGQSSCFHYLIAGGDRALIVGEELPEDDPPQGANDLKTVTQTADTTMLFGITCGLSAPYIAGQIDYAMTQENCIPVLVGFNPVQSARDSVIEKWHKSCKDTFLELEKRERDSNRGYILNPTVGPEPITGSSRMKGGSMTAILLEIVFTTAIARTFSLPLQDIITKGNPTITPHLPLPLHQMPAGSKEGVKMNRTVSNSSRGDKEITKTTSTYSTSIGQSQIATLVDAFMSTYNAAYRPSLGLAALVSIAGDSLRQPKGHLYYIGTQMLGILGFVDSSEMVSTYGSTSDEVRGFVLGGWTTCQNTDGDLSDKGHLYQISTSDFKVDILPTLTDQDTVIWLHSPQSPSSREEKQIDSLVDKVLHSPSKACHLCLWSDYRHEQEACPNDSKKFACTVLVHLPYFSVLGAEDIFAGFALKLILNAISTGANVLKGRVFGNRMINLTVANDKLFYRSISIVAELAQASMEEARDALLKAIYDEDAVDKYLTLPVSVHIKAAIKKNMVVPLGTLLAKKRFTVREAQLAMKNHSNVRSIIA